MKERPGTRQEQTEEVNSGWMPQEDLWEDRTLQLGGGDGHRKSIPGREGPVQTP